MTQRSIRRCCCGAYELVLRTYEVVPLVDRILCTSPSLGILFLRPFQPSITDALLNPIQEVFDRLQYLLLSKRLVTFLCPNTPQPKQGYFSTCFGCGVLGHKKICSSFYRLRLSVVRGFYGRRDTFSVICLSQTISTSLSLGIHITHVFKGQ